MKQTPNGVEALVKLLAVIGFFSLIALILWLAFLGLRIFPTAFSSLASIAETINDYRPESELTIELEKTIVNSGETFQIRWTEMGIGSYLFNYHCVDGVTVSIRTSDDINREVPCTDTLTLTEDVLGLFLTVTTKEQRFSDVSFTLTFDGTNGDSHIAMDTVTVVNATVPTKTKGNTVAATPVTPSKATPEMPKTPVTNTPPQQTPVTPVIVPAPNFTDLAVTYLGVGTISDDRFVPKATFDTDETAAFRFAVKNIGTKTSMPWKYALTLPGNEEYTSDTQTPLTPGEGAIFTVSFDAKTDKSTSVNIGGTISTSNDSNANNNSFTWSVKVSR